MKKGLNLLVSIAVLFTSVSCGNIFSTTIADTTTDDAYLYTAKQQMNLKQYVSAQKTLEKMTTTAFNKRDVQVLYASAFAGQCGLDVIQLALNMQTAAQPTLFLTLLRLFRGSVQAQVDACETAESVLAAQINSGSPTVDEDFLMIFISLAKIGTILAKDADPGNTGSPTAGYDKCVVAGTPDIDVKNIGTSISWIVISLANAGGTISGLNSAGITAFCATAAGILGSNPCTITTTGGFNAAATNVLRGVMSANEIGLDTCTAGGGHTTTNCVPPQCP